MACPNVNSPQWQKLVAKVGIYQAFTEFIRNGETIPDADQYEQSIKGVNYALKLSYALIRSRNYDSSNPNKLNGFFNDLKRHGTPDDQIDLLKKYIQQNGITYATQGELLAIVASEMTYTITTDIATSKSPDYKMVERDGNFEPEPIEPDIEEDFESVYDDDGNYLGERSTGMRIKNQKELDNIDKEIPTKHYEYLTVPGGVNYRESEIRTPGIQPVQRGHAAFSSNEGIGWFRSDDKGVIEDVRELTAYDKGYLTQQEREEAIDYGETDETIAQNIELAKTKPTRKATAEGDNKTRRILEVQSDLFQKNREASNLVKYKNVSFPFTFEGNTYSETPNEFIGIYFKNGESIDEEEMNKILSAYDRNNTKQENDFLQLLNKENNWVTFFIKSILQDSARKGYEKVMFPAGATANKIEKQETLENYIKIKEDRLKELNSAISGTKPIYREGNISTILDRSEYEKLKKSASRVETDDDVEVLVGITPEDIKTELSGHRDLKNIRDVYVRYESLYGEPYLDFTFDEEAIDSDRSKFLREKEQIDRELKDARAGNTSFAKIASFYQNDVRNILSKQGYNPKPITDEFGNGWFEITLQPPREESAILFQLESPNTKPSKASPGTIAKIREFLTRVGVDVKSLGDITMDGTTLGINGIADPLNKLIQITEGREDIALTEEAMHVAVEIIRQKDPALFKRMFNSIGRYNVTQQVIDEYGSIPEYKIEGKPDIPKLKTEAIGKVLAQTFINLSDKTTEDSALLAQTRTWWQAIIDFLKKLFLRAQMNPFEEAAKDIIAGKDKGTAADIKTEGKFLQVNSDVVDKLRTVNGNLARTGDSYELNGEKVRKTVQKEIEDFYKSRLFNVRSDVTSKVNDDYKKETQGRTHEDLVDILNRYIDENGKVRATPLPQTIPSSINPYDNGFYLTLENHIKERLATYPSDTTFFKDINIHDGINMAATVDLMAIVDGKVDVLQFKIPDLTRKKDDIPVYHQEAYDKEIEEIRGILERGYGIRREDFRLTRAIPIRATYQYNVPNEPKSGLKLTNMKIGSTNAKIIEDDVLIPVPSSSETTGDDTFDRFISRLRGLAKKLAKEKVDPSKRLEKAIRVATLISSIRKLQVKKDASGILSSAKTIVKRQQEKYQQLLDQIAKVDPKQPGVGSELNAISATILDDKDQVELYSQMYQVFREVFGDGTTEEDDFLKQARDVSDDANVMVSRYWNMSVNFQRQKMAAHYNITDEFKPEKQLTFYRRMIRSLSQSSTKAGSILWAMVKNINNRLALRFQDRYKTLHELEKSVDNWLKGKTVKDLYEKIFQYKDSKWNGRIIQKYSREFYTKLKEAQEKRDVKWVKDNIDIDAYNIWFKERHRELVENAKTTRIHEDDKKNKELIIQSVEQFLRTFSLSGGKGINPNNYKMKEFPKQELWYSDEYKELLKPENEPVFKVYERWKQNLEDSLDSGMIAEHNGWSWFPNVRRNLLEKLTLSGGTGKFGSLLGSIRIEAEDSAFGKIDPLTGKPVDEVHASFVSDLGEWVKGADDNYFLDYSEKSMDLFKVIALWEREMIKFELKTESEGMARMLAYTEQGRKGYLTKRSGKLARDENKRPIIIDNEVNAKYIKEHIDAVYYNKLMSNESDVSIEIPYKKAVEKINKLFGREVLPVPDQETVTVSGVKALSALNRFFITKTLGLNVLTSLAQLFGGTINTYMNQGVFMDKKDIMESELEYVSGAFWKSEERRKMAGLLHYFHAFTDDKTSQQIRDLSLSNYIKVLSSEHLFVGQRVADNTINSVIAMSFFKNTMLKDGKLVNIRQYVRKELGNADKYQGDYQKVKELNDKIEEKIEEIKNSPDALINKVKLGEKSIEIEGVDRDSDTVVDLRQAILQFTKDALGNTSKEDLSLYKRSVMWQSFFMFKNWIPRMLDVRGQSLKYSPGSQQYEWGRIRMLFRAVQGLGLSKVGSLFKQLGGNDKNVIDVAKKLYQKKREEFASQEEEFNMSEGEFVDMFIKGVRSEFKELGVALAMFGILIAARAHSPDPDEEAHVKGTYKWMVRALDKLQDEVSFFYNPTSFTNIANGSVFPAVNLLVDIEKFLYHGTRNIFFNLVGNDEGAKKEKPAKYFFKIMPITKELISYLAIFNDDMAKEYGVRINSTYGSFK